MIDTIKKNLSPFLTGKSGSTMRYRKFYGVTGIYQVRYDTVIRVKSRRSVLHPKKRI